MRVLDAQNQQVGIMSVGEALTKAHEQGTDLVEVAPKAVPPVVKLIEFHKYLYFLAKKERHEVRGKTEIKEIKLGLFSADNDLDRFASKAREFLEKNHQVKVSLWLKGRQMRMKDDARAFLYAFIQRIGNAKAASEPQMQGKVMRVIIMEDKGQHDKTENEKSV